MRLTQIKVKAIARAFGFSARYNSNYQEWRIASYRYPNDSYFTPDNDDAINTIIAMYRAYRNYNQVESICR